MIDWLYRTSLEVTLLIGLVLILRPIVRHQLGAHIAYWLWLIPLVRCFIWDKPELPAALMEKINLPNGEELLRVFPNPDNFYISDNIPLDWIWLTGFALWLVIRILGWRHLQVFLREKSTTIKLPSKLKKFIVSKKYPKEINFFLTDVPSAPFVTGLLKPKIYLPAQFFERYSLVQQHCVLDHELTHLKRKDLWSQIIGELVRAIFWFNPVVHIAWSAFREDQELACDQQVLQHSDSEVRYEYGRALVKGFHAHILPATLAFFSSKKERFIMLEKHKNSTLHNVLGITLCLLIGVFALTKAPSAIAHGDVPEGENIKLNFEDIELRKLSNIIFDFAEVEIVGLNLLENRLVNIEIDNVAPLDVAKVLLNCNGFTMQDQGEFYRISQNVSAMEIADSNQCIVKGLK